MSNHPSNRNQSKRPFLTLDGWAVAAALALALLVRFDLIRRVPW